ncbi:phosphatidylserine synthase [Escherichia coli]|uniref:Phosphatidylserine synthase n=1 Tax=Escherichia coli TaxID=562 RepID=A0A485JB95_ECOLX|nr:phosphatidylserine synthase [Escherichia coli]
MNREEMHCDVVKFKRNKHQHTCPTTQDSQSVDDVDFFYAPADFRETLLEK